MKMDSAMTCWKPSGMSSSSPMAVRDGAIIADDMGDISVKVETTKTTAHFRESAQFLGFLGSSGPDQVTRFGSGWSAGASSETVTAPFSLSCGASSAASRSASSDDDMRREAMSSDDPSRLTSTPPPSNFFSSEDDDWQTLAGAELGAKSFAVSFAPDPDRLSGREMSLDSRAESLPRHFDLVALMPFSNSLFRGSSFLK